MSSGKVVRPKVLAGALVAVLFAVFSIASYGGAGGLLTPAQANPNLMGINIAAPLDWSGDRLYANVISMSRPFINRPEVNSKTAGPAPVDTDGWPMSDFSFYVWAGIDQMHGTYTLSFKGQASVSGNPVGKISLTYNPNTNTSQGTFQYTNASSSFLTLSFTDTKRIRSSALVPCNTCTFANQPLQTSPYQGRLKGFPPAPSLIREGWGGLGGLRGVGLRCYCAPGTGITSIKLMRPLSPGSSQSYPPSTLFAAPLKALISKFSVVRFMDFLASNSNVQTNWNDRPLPSWVSFQRNPGGAYGWQGIGGPWEHVILLMNETGKDAWINIPVRATDAYIRNVALMFAYGSDGVNPYNSPQAKPVYPPLKANLKIYVEYSNKLWNSAPAFQQYYDWVIRGGALFDEIKMVEIQNIASPLYKLKQL